MIIKLFTIFYYYLFNDCRICSDIYYFIPDFDNCPSGEKESLARGGREVL